MMYCFTPGLELKVTFIMFRVVLLESLVIREVWRVFDIKLFPSFVVMFGNILLLPLLGLSIDLKVELPARRNVPPSADIVLSSSELDPKVRLASRRLSRWIVPFSL